MIRLIRQAPAPSGTPRAGRVMFYHPELPAGAHQSVVRDQVAVPERRRTATPQHPRGHPETRAASCPPPPKDRTD